MDNISCDHIESECRFYSREFPVVFNRANGSFVIDTEGTEYIDFFAGAGALNYGHNNPALMGPIFEYLQRGGIVHSLDFATEARAEFLKVFYDHILSPRRMDYRALITAPTGTNCVEAAIKIARKHTGRWGVISFTNAYHGVTQGALDVTASRFHRRSVAGRQFSACFPFDGYLGQATDTCDYLDKCLSDELSGLDFPAAIILETIQAEGGVNIASNEWLLRLQAIARRHKVLLIVDDIQMGCGRRGGFFSFENTAAFEPDIICLSKSLSGTGFPLSVLLARPHVDATWAPGEHNGTFRGFNPAFVSARAAILEYWCDSALEDSTQRKSLMISRYLDDVCDEVKIRWRGAGLIFGLELPSACIARVVAVDAFRNGLLVERVGREGTVLKLIPPLTTEDDVLEKGLSILVQSIRSTLS